MDSSEIANTEPPLDSSHSTQRDKLIIQVKERGQRAVSTPLNAESECQVAAAASDLPEAFAPSFPSPDPLTPAVSNPVQEHNQGSLREMNHHTQGTEYYGPAGIFSILRTLKLRAQQFYTHSNQGDAANRNMMDMSIVNYLYSLEYKGKQSPLAEGASLAPIGREDRYVHP